MVDAPSSAVECMVVSELQYTTSPSNLRLFKTIKFLKYLECYQMY